MGISTETFQKSGYLNEDFRIFHNADCRQNVIPFHYHDFHKLVIFLSGNVSYRVEGRRYDLQSGDVILVRAGQVHQPVIHDTSLYERIIAYISPSFFAHARTDGADLFSCYTYCTEKGASLIRPDEKSRRKMLDLSLALKQSVHDEAFGADLLRRIRLTEFLLFLCRRVQNQDYAPAKEAASHPVILRAMDYINRHLSEDTLSVDQIARETAQSRSYLMHLFKSQTGYTIGGYITEKRLFHVRDLLQTGMPVTEACYRCGFSSYTAFYYAYRKKYHSAPGKRKAAEETILGE